MADLIRDSIDDAGPRPITPYYGDVSTVGAADLAPRPSVRRARRRPKQTDEYMTEVLTGNACCDAATAGAPMTVDRGSADRAPAAGEGPGVRPARGTSAGSACSCRRRRSS